MLYDSAFEKHNLGDTIFSGALPKATQKLLATAIQQFKGFGFSGYSTRVYYKPEGYNGITRDTLRIEFAVVGSPNPGKVAAEVSQGAGLLQVNRDVATVQ